MDDLNVLLLKIAEARFWAKVDKRGPDECWNWQASRRVGGYGQFSFMKKPILSHRVAYMLANGSIPSGSDYHGVVIRHKCDNPSCCNPAHLEAGSQKDNVHDMIKRGRRVDGTRNGEHHPNALLSNEDRAAIVADSRGHSEVGRAYGVSPQVVFYIRKTWTPEREFKDGRSDSNKGGENPNSKLNDEDIRAIRGSDEKPGIVAKRYNITPDYVTMIRKRKVWKHVE